MTYFVLSNLLYLFWWMYCPGLASVSLFSLVLPCLHRPAVLRTLLHFFVTWQDVATLEPGIYPQELLASLIESSIYILALGVHIDTHVSLFLHDITSIVSCMHVCLYISLVLFLSVCLRACLSVFLLSIYPSFKSWVHTQISSNGPMSWDFFKSSNFLYLSMSFSNHKWLIYHCLW